MLNVNIPLECQSYMLANDAAGHANLANQQRPTKSGDGIESGWAEEAPGNPAAA